MVIILGINTKISDESHLFFFFDNNYIYDFIPLIADLLYMRMKIVNDIWAV